MSRGGVIKVHAVEVPFDGVLGIEDAIVAHLIEEIANLGMIHVEAVAISTTQILNLGDFHLARVAFVPNRAGDVVSGEDFTTLREFFDLQ